MIGGFLASVWTDLFQSVMMFFGVMVFLFLALSAVGGDMEQATRTAVENTVDGNSPPGRGIPCDGRTQFLPIGLADFVFLRLDLRRIRVAGQHGPA